MKISQIIWWLVRALSRDGVFLTITAPDPEYGRLKLWKVAEKAGVKIIEFEYIKCEGNLKRTPISNRI